MNHSIRYALLAGMLLLAACGDPQESAQARIEKAQTSLQGAADMLDPEKRVSAYDAIIKDVEEVAKKYPKTTIGEAIAAGRAVDGVSLAEIQHKRDTLAARAKCYANPTVDCLTPFGSGATSNAAGGSPQSAFAQAEQLVCDKGFSAADKALDPFKINKQAYAKELIQVGFAAAKCDKPDEVKAAIGAYMTADPAQGGQRVSDLLSILATEDLKDGWPVISAELERELKSDAIGEQDAANVTLTLAINYANMGDTKAALDKYAYFTDTLGYKADSDSVDKLAIAAMLAGDVDLGLKIASQDGNPDYAINQTRAAALALASRMMGLSFDKYGSSPNSILNALDSHKNGIEDYFAPVDAKDKTQDEKAADAIETQLDELASAVKAPRQGTIFSITRFDDAYGAMAIVRQKLGEPDKANAVIKKISDLRQLVFGQVDGGGNFGNISDFAAARFLVSLAQMDLDAAVHYMKVGNLSSDSAGQLLCITVGRTQNAEQTLAIANAISQKRDLWHCYHDFIPEIAKAGKPGEVEKLLAAYPGDPRDKDNFYLDIVDGMIASGDASGARSYAEKHDLVKDDKGKLSLDSRLMDSDKVAKNSGEAEPIIREIFRIGEASDVAANAKGESYEQYARGRSYVAEGAAADAFKNGYTDLGIELYEKATYKDHRPLLFAFTDTISKSDMTKVLMLAQDNATSPQYLSYVVDAAIRHLEKTGG